jgi:hypothetical protein
MKGKIATNNLVAVFLVEGKHLESGLWTSPSAGGGVHSPQVGQLNAEKHQPKLVI